MLHPPCRMQSFNPCPHAAARECLACENHRVESIRKNWAVFSSYDSRLNLSFKMPGRQPTGSRGSGNQFEVRCPRRNQWCNQPETQMAFVRQCLQLRPARLAFLEVRQSGESYKCRNDVPQPTVSDTLGGGGFLGLDDGSTEHPDTAMHNKRIGSVVAVGWLYVWTSTTVKSYSKHVPNG